MSDGTKPYHHNNLREALIQQGITMLHRDGVQNFSLRKLAKEVGVSATACYNHFSCAEELFREMLDYITDKFTNALSDAIDKNPCNSITVSMGCAYVEFFATYPHYFSLLFDSGNLGIHITDTEILFDDSFPPFSVFVKGAKQELTALQIDEAGLRDNLLIMWATVHGLAAMANMKGIHYDGSWQELTKKLLFDKINLSCK